MKLKIEIKMDNAAFTNRHEDEVSSILQDIVNGLRQGVELYQGLVRPIRDTNGNTVGHLKISK